MSIIWRLVLFLYNLIIIALAVIALALATGQKEPVYYLNIFLANPQNAFILAAASIGLLIIAVIVLFKVLRADSGPTLIVLRSDTRGEVMISIPAVNTLIMKAVKKVEGSKEVKAKIKPGSKGLTVQVRTLVDPEYNVPELTENMQEVIINDLETIGGLKIDKVIVLVDETPSV